MAFQKSLLDFTVEVTKFGSTNAGTGSFRQWNTHNGTLTAERTLTWDLNDANRAVSLSGTLTVSANATISGTNTGDQTSVTGNAGTATALQIARAIYGNNFDGTAALTQVIASTFGGTGNGFTKISGPTTAERTKTMRDATDTVLELGGSYTPTGTWTSMTMVTPTLGVATATSINKVTFTQPATAATLTILNNKTFAVNHSLTLAGTDSTTMTFPTTSATIARTDAANTFTGTQTFPGLVDVTNGQIKFPAAQNASADVNTLDDYEEGSFPSAPTITFGGGSTGITYGAQAGHYVVIGKMVFYSISLVLTSKGSSTGVALINNLPFTASSGATFFPASLRISVMTSGVGDTMLYGAVNGSATTLRLDKIATGNVTQLTDADFTATSQVFITGSYQR
jgi:hypothetical protein